MYPPHANQCILSGAGASPQFCEHPLLEYQEGVVGRKESSVLLPAKSLNFRSWATLMIAALFTSLRRRIQAFIDSPPLPQQDAAAKALEAFSAKLCDETDLDALIDELVSVVRETMQSACLSL